MHGTTVIIDGCGFGVDDIQLPGFSPQGVPTGDLIDVKQLTFVVSEPPSQLLVHVRFTPEQFEEFIRQISGKRVIEATPADLAKLNGS